MSILTRIDRHKNLILRSRFHYYRMAMVHPPFWLFVRGKTERVLAEDTPGATAIYTEVVVEDCYDILTFSRSHSPQVIVDIGANIGLFSQLCSMVFPQAKIYAYEPHPQAVQWLRKNAKNKTIQVIEGAVSSQLGDELRLDLGEDSTVAHLADTGQVVVPKVAVADVAEGRQIDLLKMDCEGSEWDILQDESLLKRAQYFCLEYHLISEQSLAQLKQLIEKSGHIVTKVNAKPGDERFGILWSVQKQ
jgi:FkbM family methyltransferase